MDRRKSIIKIRMAKQQSPNPSKTLVMFNKKFKKEFNRKPTHAERWSYYEGMIVAYNSFLKVRNKKH